MAKKNDSNKSSKSNINERGQIRNRNSDKKIIRNQGQSRIRIIDSGDSNKTEVGKKD